MFQTYYQFREQPFGVNPDPRFLYLSSTHREAFSSLLYRIQSDSGFLAMIAQPGMGKTTLLFHLLQKLQGTAKTAFIFQTQCTSHELLRHVLSEFECDTSITDTVRMSQELKLFLLAEANAGRRCVLIVDEAQNLGLEVLETVRLLSNFETPRRKLLNIILSGQVELGDMLERSRLNQLRQRLSCMIHLQRFTPGETALYIAHRLATAGYSGKTSDLFSLQALAAIAQLSEGIPRVINNLCFNALSLGYALEASQIDLAIIEEAAGDLGITGRPRFEGTGAREFHAAHGVGPRAAEAVVERGQAKRDESGDAPTISDFGVPEPKSKPVAAIAFETIGAASQEKCHERGEADLMPTGGTPHNWPGESAGTTSGHDTKEESDAAALRVAEAPMALENEARRGPVRSPDQRQRRNPAGLAVVGGSLFIVLLCVGAAMRLPPRRSAMARSQAGGSASTSTSVRQLRAITPDAQGQSAPAPPAATVPQRVSVSHPHHRRVFRHRTRRADRGKRGQVDLALASFAPEPLIKPLSPHPMRLSEPTVQTARPAATAASTFRHSMVRRTRAAPMYIPAKAIWQPAPTYSKFARRRIGSSGEVELLLSISSGGWISRIGVLNGNPVLAAEAIRAVRAWRYRPAMSYGEPVNSQVYVTVRFQQH